MKGFRHIVQGEHDSEFMFDQKFKHGLLRVRNVWFYLRRYLIYHHQEQATVTILNKKKFVLDHIAKPDINKANMPLALISMLGLYIKMCILQDFWDGNVEAEWDDWKPNFKTYLDTVVESFFWYRPTGCMAQIFQVYARSYLRRAVKYCNCSFFRVLQHLKKKENYKRMLLFYNLSPNFILRNRLILWINTPYSMNLGT
jgi:hypothetical protein